MLFDIASELRNTALAVNLRRSRLGQRQRDALQVTLTEIAAHAKPTTLRSNILTLAENLQALSSKTVQRQLRNLSMAADTATCN